MGKNKNTRKGNRLRAQAAVLERAAADFRSRYDEHDRAVESLEREILRVTDETIVSAGDPLHDKRMRSTDLKYRSFGTGREVNLEGIDPMIGATAIAPTAFQQQMYGPLSRPYRATVHAHEPYEPERGMSTYDVDKPEPHDPEMLADVVRRIAKLQFETTVDHMPETARLINQFPGVVEIDPSEPPVVDASAIWQRELKANRETKLYEDHPCIAPPWDRFWVAYQNNAGNVFAMRAFVFNQHEPVADPLWGQMSGWENDKNVDWDQVKWVVSTWLFKGGKTQGHRVNPIGPLNAWLIAIYEDGQPADIRYTTFILDPTRPEEEVPSHWLDQFTVWLETLSFLNCRNVTVVEPRRPRAMQRRMERNGSPRISEIAVYPKVRASYAGQTPTLLSEMEIPLHSVRGHYIRSGVDGRKHIFGNPKIVGRFWVPQHTRGSQEVGEVVAQNFTIKDPK